MTERNIKGDSWRRGNFSMGGLKATHKRKFTDVIKRTEYDTKLKALISDLHCEYIDRVEFNESLRALKEEYKKI